MVGNDVVDLADAEAAVDASHPRFDARVFGARERRRLEMAGDRARMRWILWAAKESAYKAMRRCDPALIFSPRRFEVELDEALCGYVHAPGGVLEVRIELRGDCVHALAAAAPYTNGMLQRGVARVGSAAASDGVRALAVGALSRHLGIAPEALSIRRVGRVPQLCAYGAPTGHPISLAHHGRFAAWACGLRPHTEQPATAMLEGAA
ncbi:MAG TPA: 4'-phosphopantetheinyl transferase superfamily protein [Myxococcota bacterium]